MEPEGSLPPSQAPATCPFSEPINPVHAPFPLIEDPLYYIISYYIILYYIILYYIILYYIIYNILFVNNVRNLKLNIQRHSPC